MEKEVLLIERLAKQLVHQPPEMTAALAIEISGRIADHFGAYCALTGHEETLRLVDIVKETFVSMREYNDEVHEAFKLALEVQEGLGSL